jgi:hypothetical protein
MYTWRCQYTCNTWQTVSETWYNYLFQLAFLCEMYDWNWTELVKVQWKYNSWNGYSINPVKLSRQNRGYWQTNRIYKTNENLIPFRTIYKGLFLYLWDVYFMISTALSDILQMITDWNVYEVIRNIENRVSIIHIPFLCHCKIAYAC